MEQFQEYGDAAKKKISIADHMLTQTYPLVRDSKLLMAVLENTFLALSYAMNSILSYDKLFKNITVFPENFEARFHIFREKCAPRYNISKDHLLLIRDVKDIIMAHKKSPVEFTRNDRFVICSDDYKMKAVSVDLLKRYIMQAKTFVIQTNVITNKNAGLFR